MFVCTVGGGGARAIFGELLLMLMLLLLLLAGERRFRRSRDMNVWMGRFCTSCVCVFCMENCVCFVCGPECGVYVCIVCECVVELEACVGLCSVRASEHARSGKFNVRRRWASIRVHTHARAHSVVNDVRRRLGSRASARALVYERRAHTLTFALGVMCLCVYV